MAFVLTRMGADSRVGAPDKATTAAMMGAVRRAPYGGLSQKKGEQQNRPDYGWRLCSCRARRAPATPGLRLVPLRLVPPVGGASTLSGSLASYPASGRRL